MLKILVDEVPEVLFPIEDLCISHKSTGLDVVSFEISEEHRLYPSLNGDNVRLEINDIYYNIEKIQDGSIQAKIDLDDVKSQVVIKYTGEGNCIALLTKVLPYWTIVPKTPISYEVELQVDITSGTKLDLVNLIGKTFALNFVWRNKDKVLEVYEVASALPTGDYLTEELNLIGLTYRKDTSKMATRLYCFGKEGLTFSDINDGKPYVEDFTHSNRVISQVWSDGRYTVPENLLEKGRERLQTLCKPTISYECRVVDLARLNDSYNFLAFQLHKKISILDRKRKQKVEYMIVEYDEYPDEPDRNVITLSTVPDRVKNIAEKAIDDALDDEDSKLNEKIESNTGDVMGIRVATNITNVSLANLGSELTAIPYVNNTQAWVSYHLQAFFYVTTAGTITFQLTLDSVEMSVYEQHFEVGTYFKVITFAINSSPGSHTVRAVVLSSEAKGNFPMGRSQSHILSAGITPEIPWDGTIKVSEKVPYLQVIVNSLTLRNIFDNPAIALIEHPIDQNLSDEVEYLGVSVPQISLVDIAELFKIPSEVKSAQYVDLTHIAVLFDNPITFDPSPLLASWEVQGGVSGSLTPVTVVSLTPMDRWLLIETGNFQSFDTDFLVGYSGAEVFNSLTDEAVPTFSLPFNKTVVAFTISMLTASTEYSTTETAANLLNTNNSQFWSPADADTAPRLTFQMNKVSRMADYTIRARHDNITGSLKSWVVEALVNNTWVEVDSQANQTWTTGQEKTFTIANTQLYQTFRMRITEFNASGYRGFSKFKFTEVS